MRQSYSLSLRRTWSVVGMRPILPSVKGGECYQRAPCLMERLEEQLSAKCSGVPAPSPEQNKHKQTKTNPTTKHLSRTQPLFLATENWWCLGWWQPPRESQGRVHITDHWSDAVEPNLILPLGSLYTVIVTATKWQLATDPPTCFRHLSNAPCEKRWVKSKGRVIPLCGLSVSS